MRIAVIYHSFEGNTKHIAETIASVSGAELIPLLPERESIRSHGFSKYIWGGRQVIFKECPKIVPLEKDPADYDMLFIGTPIWVGTYTPVMRTFLGTQKIEGKRIALFCTFEGGKGDVFLAMREKLPGNTFVEGMDFLNVTKDKEHMTKKAMEWTTRVLEEVKQG